jgi:hypothetical protein
LFDVIQGIGIRGKGRGSEEDDLFKERHQTQTSVVG